MVYRENLPEHCPPKEAAPLSETTTFYRLVKAIPPQEGDFDSRWEEREDFRAMWEQKGNVCDAKGLSLFDDAAAALQKTKHREHANKVVCQVDVTPDCGPIKQGTSHHFTWWPMHDCNVLALCQGNMP